jgi:hypothetical protein
MGRFDIPPHVTSEAADLIRCCLRVDQNARISSTDFLHHPWFQLYPVHAAKLFNNLGISQSNTAAGPSNAGFECESFSGSINNQDQVKPYVGMQTSPVEEPNLGKLKEHLKNLPVVSSLNVSPSNQNAHQNMVEKQLMQQKTMMETQKTYNTIQRFTPDLLKPLEANIQNRSEKAWNLSNHASADKIPNNSTSTSKALHSPYTISDLRSQPSNHQAGIPRSLLASPSGGMITLHYDYNQNTPYTPTKPSSESNFRLPSSESSGSLQGIKIQSFFNPTAHNQQWSSSQPQPQSLRLRSASRQEQGADLSEASKLNAHISLARQLFSATQGPTPNDEKVVITSRFRKPEDTFTPHHVRPELIGTPERTFFPKPLPSTPQRPQLQALPGADHNIHSQGNTSGLASPKMQTAEELKRVSDVSRSKSPGSQVGKNAYRSLLGNTKGSRGTPTIPIKQPEDHYRCPSSDTRTGIHSQRIQ